MSSTDGPDSDPIAMAEQPGRVGVERISSAAQIRALSDQLAVSIQREACSMLPGGPYPLSYLRGSWQQDTRLIDRGVRCLAIYQADAVREPGVLRYLSDLVARGGQVRVALKVTHRTLIVDRSLVVVAVGQDQLTHPFLLIREPALVRTFHTNFADVWRGSRSIGVGAEDAIAAENVGETVEILQSGVTDEVAARQLGVSVRTVRRRVATVLELLGANSRFEAGVKAAKAGWI